MYEPRKMCPWTPRKLRRPRRPPAANAAANSRPASFDLPLFDLIVRRFARDDHVMHVAFAQPRDRDPHEPRALLQLRERCHAAIAHSALESAHELIDQRAERSLVRDAPFDALRHGFPAR